MTEDAKIIIARQRMRLLRSMGRVSEATHLAMALVEVGSGVQRGFTNRGRPNQQNTDRALMLYAQVTEE